MKEYRFDGSISLEVLNNYLDRAVTYTGHFMPTLYSDTDQKNIDEAIRFITNVGAKYIQRAGGEWHPSVVPLNNFDTIKANISSAHEIDPDIIFESCILKLSEWNLKNVILIWTAWLSVTGIRVTLTREQ